MSADFQGITKNSKSLFQKKTKHVYLKEKKQ